MNNQELNKLAKIYAIQAEIDGMKAENECRKSQNFATIYHEVNFNQKAQELLSDKQFTKKDLARVVEYMLKHPISEDLRTELIVNFDKGVFVLTEYMNKILKLNQTSWDIEVEITESTVKVTKILE
jgi:hypothetical protein